MTNKSLLRSSLVNNRWYETMLVGNPGYTPLIEYIVIAGGGGGGGANTDQAGGVAGGGGGAGGYRSSVTNESSGGGASAESPFSLAIGTNYTVTVGAGGAAGTGSVVSSKGGSSTFNTVTSVGGGAAWARFPLNSTPPDSGVGGSGGGGSSDTNSGNGGTGTSNQGRNGGNGQIGYRSGAGGGGAFSVGGDSVDASKDGGAGGSGVSSSITGLAITRAAGGGGGGGNTTGTGSGGLGGSGGGGRGGDRNGNSRLSAGAAAMGAGGGGSGAGTSGGLQSGGNGGSGTVILRYPEGNYISVGAGLSAITTVSGGFGITQVFSGTGNVSFQVPSGTIPVNYFVVSGGQSGSGFRPGVAWGDGGDGGQVNGGVLFVTPSTSLSCQVGAGGAGVGNGAHSNSGGTSIFSTITSASRTDSTFTLNGGFGMNGLSGPILTPSGWVHWGGLGATFEGVGYGGGGSWGNSENPSGYTTGHLFGGGAASEGGGVFFTAQANRGGGGYGARLNGATSEAGGSGIVILKYPSAFSISGGAGLTSSTSTSGSYKITTFTQGVGSISFS